jgi:hypothetical protein
VRAGTLSLHTIRTHGQRKDMDVDVYIWDIWWQSRVFRVAKGVDKTLSFLGFCRSDIVGIVGITKHLDMGATSRSFRQKAHRSSAADVFFRFRKTEEQFTHKV